jgi:hypothetical protein
MVVYVKLTLKVCNCLVCYDSSTQETPISLAYTAPPRYLNSIAFGIGREANSWTMYFGYVAVRAVILSFTVSLILLVSQAYRLQITI